MSSPWASVSLRASVCALALAWLPGCPSEQTPAQPPVVDRIVIGGSQAPDPPHKVAVDPSQGGVPLEPPPPPPEEPAVARSEPPAPPLDPGVLDERPGALRARSKALLVTELQGLEALYATIPKTGPDRPKVVRRLADVYGELAACAEREAASAPPSRPSDAAALQKMTAAARDKAIKYYTLLSIEYPSFCERLEPTSPTSMTGCADEVFYYIGYEEQRAGRLDRARRSYFQLIKSYPESRFVPYAFFAFGEAFYETARSDPTGFALAAQAYERVLRFKGSKLAPYSESRLRLVCPKISAIGAAAPAVCDTMKGPSAVKAVGGDDGQ